MGEVDNVVVKESAPRGFHQTKVDERGRLKLPALVLQWMKKFGDEQLFITTIDLRTIRIYRIPVWEENEKIFAQAGDAAEEADNVSFLANHFGADSEIDGQGRVLLSQEIRSRFEIENKPVWLECKKEGVIVAYDEAMYKQKLNASIDANPTSVGAMKKLGMK